MDARQKGECRGRDQAQLTAQKEKDLALQLMSDLFCSVTSDQPYLYHTHPPSTVLGL